MPYNKFQKKIVKTIIEFESDGADIVFKDLFQKIMDKHLVECGIIMYENKLFIKSDNFLRDKNKVLEVFHLIEYLIKNELLRFIKTEKLQKNFEIEYKYRIYSEENITKVNIDINTIELIYNNLYSDFYITTGLKELKDNNFLTIEQINLKITRRALYVSIGVSILTIAITIFGFYWQWHVATKVSTVIEFSNFEDLKYISELIKNLSK